MPSYQLWILGSIIALIIVDFWFAAWNIVKIADSLKQQNKDFGDICRALIDIKYAIERQNIKN